MNKTKHIPIRCKGSRSLSYRVLKPFQGNLKEMSKVSADKLKASILKYGWRFPVFVWKDGKTEWVHDGHGRLLVLKAMIADGYTIDDLPVADIEAKDKREAGELLLALNSRYQSITEEGLYEFMNEMEIDPVDLDMFDLPDIDLDEFREGYFEDGTSDEGEDDVPEVPEKPKSKLGDLYQLGEHRVLCGDATKAEDVERVMEGKKADMVFTDPPYGMNLDTDWSGAKSSLRFAKEKKALGGKKHKPVIGDDEDFDPLFILNEFLYCKEIFLWGADYYAERLIDKNKGSWIVWDKRLDESADKMYGSCFELCWSKGRHKRNIARIKWAGIFGTEKEPEHKRVHPTQKPMALVEWFFSRWARDGGTVVDIFLGSGSTLIASEKTSRICYGMEIDPHYIDVIVQRWVDYTGQTDIIKNGKKIKWQVS